MAPAIVIVVGTVVWIWLARNCERVGRIDRFKILGLAISNYETRYGWDFKRGVQRVGSPSFPPACLRDKNGKAVHSWRVLVLPYLEESNLFKRYRFDEPWDGPHNRLLVKEMPVIYGSPASSKREGGITNYVAVVGPGTAWSAGGHSRRPPGTPSRHDRILMIEYLKSDIKWSEPRDLTVNEAMRVIHGGDFYLGTDFSVDEVPAGATPDEIRKLLTVDGADVPAEKQSPPAGQEKAKREGKPTAPKTP
jgi:hypothetical protein